MMILACYFGNERNAMGDGYKNLLNAFPNKKNIYVIIPHAYNESEFSTDFAGVERENLSNKGKMKRFPAIIEYAADLAKRFKSVEDTIKIFFYHDQFAYDYFILKKIINSGSTVWLHDPIQHEGTRTLEKYYRTCSFYLLFDKIKTFILSYEAAKKLVQYDKRLRCLINRTTVLPLPTLPELEFEDIKTSEIPIKYDYIFWGRIELYKGLEFLIETLKDEYFKGKKILMIGKGSDAEKVKKMVVNQPNITFINRYVENRELAKYICASRCAVLPYISATGSQTVSVANYYNRMVVASNVGCFPEYITNGKNGFIFQVLDKSDFIEKLQMIDKINLKKQEIFIQEEYKKHDIKVIAKKLYNIIIKD